MLIFIHDFKNDFPKTSNKSKFPQLITGIYKKNFIFNGKRVSALLLEPGKRQGSLTTPTHHCISDPSQCKNNKKKK